MREKFNVNDEFGKTRIEPGRFFDLVFWAAESVYVVGQYTKKGNIILYFLDDANIKQQKFSIRQFKKLNIGNNYCDIVILDSYPKGTTLQDFIK